MAGYKPSDVFIGLVDLFSVLLPGAMLVALFLEELVAISDQILPPLDEPLKGWVAFVVGAFVVGHILKHLSAQLLNRLYWRFYFRHYCASVKLLEGKVSESLTHDIPGIDTFTWARSYVRATNSAAAEEIQRFEADSKFFRSLSLVVAVAGVQALVANAWLAMIGSITLMLFAFWRYCHLRRSEAHRTYEYYTLLKEEALTG